MSRGYSLRFLIDTDFSLFSVDNILQRGLEFNLFADYIFFFFGNYIKFYIKTACQRENTLTIKMKLLIN
jgi:hypothetical protein